MRKLLLLLVFSFSYLTAHDGETPLFISLGAHCEPANMFRDTQLRTVAYPFDWMRSPDHEGLISLLQEDFRFFLEDEYFLQNPFYLHECLHERYGLEFRHEWPFLDFPYTPNRYPIHFQELKAKYARRIDRFRELRDFQGRVFFFRVPFDFEQTPHPFWGKKEMEKITQKQAKELRDALRQFFPKLAFTLVIINYDGVYNEKIESFNGIMGFSVRKTHKLEDYMSIFKSLIQKTDVAYPRSVHGR